MFGFLGRSAALVLVHDAIGLRNAWHHLLHVATDERWRSLLDQLPDQVLLLQQFVLDIGFGLRFRAREGDMELRQSPLRILFEFILV